MLDWIDGNSQTINAIINLCMLFVWVAYLQVFVSNYKRQQRAKILINLGSGLGLNNRCLVSNMSSEAIYINSIIIEEECGGVRHSAAVTELDDIEGWEHASDINLWSRQGPLKPGEMRDMGSFASMLDHALNVRPRRDTEGKEALTIADAFSVVVFANYASEDLMVGARRRFHILSDGGTVRLRPETVGTIQIRSRRERRKIERSLESA